MLYRPISDIHREIARTSGKMPFEPSPLTTDKETILGIAGDFDSHKFQLEFLSKMSERFHSVVFVCGNHDYWKRSLDTHQLELKKHIKELGLNNVHFLNKESVIIDGIQFVGATLWTDFKKGDPLTMIFAADKHNGLNDFKRIRASNYSKHLTPQIEIVEHLRDKSFIFKHSQDDLPTVVISHHAPCELSCSSNKKYDPSDLLNYGYFTELGNEIAYSKFKLWHHGHVHHSVNYTLGDTNIITNPFGYDNSHSSKDLNIDFDDTLRYDLKTFQRVYI
jgi:DNA repair exonuclease SbcCD nuclease subunit